MHLDQLLAQRSGLLLQPTALDLLLTLLRQRQVPRPLRRHLPLPQLRARRAELLVLRSKRRDSALIDGRAAFVAAEEQALLHCLQTALNPCAPLALADGLRAQHLRL